MTRHATNWLWRASAGAMAMGLLAAAPAWSQPAAPDGYPADYSDIIKAGTKEGTVVVYTSTDIGYAQHMIDAFKERYPGIEIDYNDIGTTNTYNRVISEAAAGQVGADFVWTNAMPLQAKLVADGYGQEYDTPEAKNLPDWARYRNTAYGTTFEPVGIGYNNKLLPENLVPHTRADLIALLRDHGDLLKGKVMTFDPEKSGSAFLFQAMDSKNRDDYWDLIKLFGSLDGRSYASGGQVRETLISGENILVFNFTGSYLIVWAKDNPTLSATFGSDYTMAFTRPAFIPKDAPHPNAAKLFLDFALSAEGQRELAKGGLAAVRGDLGEGVYDATGVAKITGGSLTPIAIDDGLLDLLDPSFRTNFLKQWNEALGR